MMKIGGQALTCTDWVPVYDLSDGDDYFWFYDWYFYGYGLAQKFYALEQK